MKISIDNNVVKESLTVDGKIRLETKEVFKLCKPSYSCTVRMAYFEDNRSLPEMHKYTPETIENSGIDYISYEEDGQDIYSCFDSITFEEMVYILTYHNQHNREVNKTAVQRDAIEMLEDEYKKIWAATKQEESEQRERLWMAMKLIPEFERQLRIIVEKGIIKKNQIVKIKKNIA